MEKILAKQKQKSTPKTKSAANDLIKSILSRSKKSAPVVAASPAAPTAPVVAPASAPMSALDRKIASLEHKKWVLWMLPPTIINNQLFK